MRTLLLLVLATLGMSGVRLVAAADSASDEGSIRKTWRSLEDLTWEVWRNAWMKNPTPGLTTPDASAVARAGAALKSLLLEKKHLTDYDLEYNADQRVDFIIAMAWVNEHNGRKAYRAFAEAASAYPVGGHFHLIDDSREPFYFAQDVFRLHAQIIALTGHAAALPGLGYRFFVLPAATGAPQVVFLYAADDCCEGDIPVENVAKDEQRKLIYLLSPGEKGDYTASQHAEVIAARRKFSVSVRRGNQDSEVVLRGVRKFVEFTGDPEDPWFSVRDSPRSELNLRVADGKLQQPVDAIAQAAPAQR